MANCSGDGIVKLGRRLAELGDDEPPASYHRYRFPPEIISHAVWLYHRFCLSFRDTEELLAQRGITVSYEAIRQWLSDVRSCVRSSPPVPPGTSG